MKMKIEHNGKIHDVAHDHQCGMCSSDIHALVFDVRKSKRALYVICHVCQFEHTVKVTAMICAHCGFHKSDFVLAQDDIMCAECSDSYHFDGEAKIERTLSLDELSECSVCDSAYIRHEEEEHTFCSIICYQTLLDRDRNR